MRDFFLLNTRSLFRLEMVGLFYLLFIYGCASPASQAVQRADGLLAAKDHYGASQAYLDALRMEPSHQEAKNKLCQIAKDAYNQKFNMASSYEKSSDFELAIPQYQQLSIFIDKINSYNCLNFVTINAKQKTDEMKSGASEKDYKEAEKFFTNSDYDNAIIKYKKSLSQNGQYKDCKEKIAESYYRMAISDEKQKSFRKSADSYLNANKTISGYKNAPDKATSLYYGLGLSFLKQKLCRNAYDDFSMASQLNSDYKDLSSKLADAEACAISKIAFMRFDNPTGRTISGMAIGDFIFDEMRSKLHKDSSKFIRTIDRDELETVLDEQRLGKIGITEDYSKFKKLKGVDYLIFGKITQVKVNEPNEKVENLKSIASQGYRCMKQGKKEPYETWCYKDVYVYWDRHSAKIDIALSGSLKVVSVATGEQIIMQSISAKRSDSITYGVMKSDITSETTLQDGLDDILKANRNLKDKDDLVKDIISDITSEMVAKILDQIDKKKTVSDPVDLALK